MRSYLSTAVGLLAGCLGLAAATGCSILDPPKESGDGRDRLGPSRVLDLRVQSVEPVSASVARVCFSFTAPGDDGQEGTAREYELAYTPDGSDILRWSTDNRVPPWGYWRVLNPKPGGEGEQRCWELRVPPELRPFYVAMRAIDDVGNVGLVSNSAIIR